MHDIIWVPLVIKVLTINYQTFLHFVATNLCGFNSGIYILVNETIFGLDTDAFLIDWFPYHQLISAIFMHITISSQDLLVLFIACMIII